MTLMMVNLQVEVTAVNGAGSSTAVASDGVRVDHTPPDLLYVRTAAGTSYQQDQTSLSFVWAFEVG
jgi:hypothetical protein